MDRYTAHILNELNKQFYATNAVSFSNTRANPWNGWERLTPYIENATSVLDVACGNMRFERFVLECCPSNAPKFYCIDSCPELVSSDFEASFQMLDIVDLCIADNDLSASIDVPPCDLVVSFGFLHHVPGIDARERLLGALVEKTTTGGIIVLSFWQFMKNERLASKAKESTARLQQKIDIKLDEYDYLLGWQDVTTTCRYCHHFTDEEIDELIDSSGSALRILERFKADGKTIPLNMYVVLQKR